MSNIYPTNANMEELNQPKSSDAKLEVKDEFVKSEGEAKKATYDKPELDQVAFEKRQQENDGAYNSLKQLVTRLLEIQGLTFRDWSKIEVDKETRNELIDKGGELSPEKVSDRIVEFAKAISGGDREKINILRGVIGKGFMEAGRILGGELPEASQKTYDLVMEKFDNWM